MLINITWVSQVLYDLISQADLDIIKKNKNSELKGQLLIKYRTGVTTEAFEIEFGKPVVDWEWYNFTIEWESLSFDEIDLRDVHIKSSVWANQIIIMFN